MTWAASQIAAHADDPARAYRALRELVAAAFEPVSRALPSPARTSEPGPRAPRAPAPEIALSLPAEALLDALAPPPRVACRELARTGAAEARARLADARPERRILGVRGLAPSAITGAARELAAALVDPDLGVRVEATRLVVQAPARARDAIARALRARRAEGSELAHAIDALRVLGAPFEVVELVRWLGDPDPAIRAAGARAISGPESLFLGGTSPQAAKSSRPGGALAPLVAALADDAREVRVAALAAIARSPALHIPAVVPALCAIVANGDDTRPAIYVLAKLRADPAVAPALAACVRGPRSDVALAAAMVLRELGHPIPDIAIDERVERAAGELASHDPGAIESGLLEARRLGEAAAPLAPVLRRLVDDYPLARECLTALGHDAGEPTGWLEPYRGRAPSEPERHGAYVIARVSFEKDTAMGLWDGATGKRVFVVPGAVLLAFVPGRAEVAALIVTGYAWSFARFAVPTGEPLATLAIPEVLAYGIPAQLSLAGGLATVWCDDRAAPYRFHVKLDEADRLLDDAPVPGRRGRPRQ